MSQRDFQPRLNRFDAVMIVMGAIIGAGIFFTPRTIAQNVEHPTLALGVWLIGGVIALAGATTYAELGSALPRVGGQYVFLREAYGGLVAFLYGWVLMLAIVSGAIAVVALTFAQYLGRVLPGEETAAFEQGVAIGVILLLTGVNVLGIRPGSLVQNLFTVLKIVALLALVVTGVVAGSASGILTAERVERTEGSFIAAIAAVLFSYGGWQNLTYVAGEVKNPRRNLPVAILIGVAGVTFLYVAGNFAFLSLLSLDTIAETSGFASEAVSRIFGSSGDFLFAIAICCSTFGIINVLLLATPRVYFAMGRDGVFFRKAGELHPRFETPVLAILIQGIWPALLLLFANAGSLLNYVVFADWVFFGLTGFSLILLRRRQKEHEGAYRSFGYPLVPLFFTTVSAAVVVSLLIDQWADARWGLLIVLGGVPVYFGWKKLAR